MADTKCSRYSGIGGQAVLEGIMMKNEEKYAVAVRKPDGKIEIELDNYQGILSELRIRRVPFVRGIFNFIDSMVLGMKCLNYSVSFYDDEEEAPPVKEESAFSSEEGRTASRGEEKGASAAKGEKLMTTLVTCFAVVMAVGIFVVLPYFLASLFNGFIWNQSLKAIVEGLLRIVIFLLYVWGISAMKDIKRLYAYHGAEHKCINCIEGGKPLTVRNVMESSRLHKRCGTSFIFFVLIVSIILFMFIRVPNPIARVVVRILLMPVVAGISYEIIRLAGRSDNCFVRAISAPGMAVQRMTTKEPDESMAEVAIAAVEAVFDWKMYLRENFGYEEQEQKESADK